MKTLLCCTIAAFMTFFAHAQPVITSANNPVIGEVDSLTYVDSAGISPGPGGTGVIWNFVPSVTTGYATVTFRACTSTPYCDSFPGSNLVSYTIHPSSDSSYDYLNANTASLDFNGGCWFSPSPQFSYQSHNSLIRYPFTYGDCYLDTVYTRNYASGTFLPGTTSDSIAADGYGTLILPTGTYNNVLRVKRWQTNSAITGRAEIYYWYKQGCHMPLMCIAQDFTAMGTVSYQQSFYYSNAPLPVEIAGIKKMPVDIKAYPNPATDMLNISFALDDATNAVLTILDITGRTLRMVDLLESGTNNISINTHELTAGLYTLLLHTNTCIVTQKITITK